MGKINLFPPTAKNNASTINELPGLLQTPGGLALLEIQGTLNSTIAAEDGIQPAIPIGKLSFPLYDAANTSGDTAWQKRVHLYVGDNQRLTGELKKLPMPLAVLQKRVSPNADDLEVVEIIYYKLQFTHRPEPFGTAVVVEGST